MKQPLKKALLAVICVALIVLAAAAVLDQKAHQADIPGLRADARVLLRIWAVSAPGGGHAWLKEQLRAFEKQHPHVATYLRTVSAAELTQPDAVLPDVVLYMPGDLTSPQSCFLPLSGDMVHRESSAIREELLRCGRWQTQQYGLPLCWGAWVLCIDGALEPGSAATSTPTTLLGRPAATDSPSAMQEPAYPLDAASRAECPLLSPGGAALFSLGMLLKDRPPLPDGFGSLSSGEVYASFQKRQCATAMLTTGQETALAGSGFPYRTMVPEEIITDQVWLASVTAEAPREAAHLLSCLTSAPAQKALSAQGLHTVRDDLTLYAAGTSARVEQAARQALTAVSAYISSTDAAAAAWQYFQRGASLPEALLSLV